MHFAGQPCEHGRDPRRWRRDTAFRDHRGRLARGRRAATSGEPVGSCRWADITVFSFHPVKIITTGEGGMALTNDAAARRAPAHAAQPRHHARRRRTLPARRPTGAWYYEQQLARLQLPDDRHAGGARAQPVRAGSKIPRRARAAWPSATTAARRPAAASAHGRRRSGNPPSSLCIVDPVADRTDGATASSTRLRARGIGVNLHYIPVHLQPYYRALGFNDGDFPGPRLLRGAVSLPLYAALR